ncbi:hypothetical protein [Streptomyces hundungensis]|uniref:hypothetical protein n=1 Tax=Streptomyces hundungensis TaxID=1077946 RepID=UPI0033F72D26
MLAQQASEAGRVLGGVLGQARVGGVGQGFRARFVEQRQGRSMCLECAEVDIGSGLRPGVPMIGAPATARPSGRSGRSW